MMLWGRRGVRCALALTLALAAIGCDSADPIGTACPLLRSGAAPGLSWGATLVLDAPADGDSIAPGALRAQALWLPEGAAFSAVAQLDDALPSLFLYGPRDARGAVATCIAVGADHDGEGAIASLSSAVEGEYLIVAGPAVGATGGALSVSASCDNALCTEAESPCPTLSELGCEATRCDGELKRDDQGCLTCDCQSGRVCGADRSDGPSGTCILPACDCTQAPGAEICGADGQTWPSTCAAHCAGVPVALPDACDVPCPDLQGCDAPCKGLRALSATTGCPTCECAPATPESAEDCAACSLDESPVCGADGVTYRNRCVARCAGARLLYRAACVEGCRRPPEGCTLDCPYGLRLGDACTLCDCAPAPSPGCVDAGDTVCVTFPGLSAPTTVGSPCLANDMGATDGTWGPCGRPCTAHADCPLGSGCQATGALADRCLILGDVDQGCSAVIDYVCGDDNQTYANGCLSRINGTLEAHRGACCEPDTSDPCDAGSARPVTASGCPDASAPCSPIVDACMDVEDVIVEACTFDNTLMDSACIAHTQGGQASPTWCLP
jgi:hypothetical protein